MQDREERIAQLIAEARSWIGTPYHNKANIKGVGVDCAWIIYLCYRMAGLCPEVDVPDYSPQWFLHHGEEVYLDLVVKSGGKEIAAEEADMGDLILFRIGRLYAHGAIMVSKTHMIHAFKEAHQVMESEIDGGYLASRKRRFFRVGV